MAVREVNWLDLPDHITLFMADKLSRCDFIRLGAVCKPWNSVYNAHSRHSLPRQLPTLLVNEDLDDKHATTNHFYEFQEERMYSSKVLVPSNMFYIGSSCGCLVLFGRKQGTITPRVRISYPFSTTLKDIDLPPLLGETSVDKVVLSANPSSDKDYIVMALASGYVYRRRLTYFKPSAGDQANWNYISGISEPICDILYYNQKQQFYALNDSGDVFACDLNDLNNPKVLQILAPPSYLSSSWKGKDNNRYLVELSSGELLLIVRYQEVIKLSDGSKPLCTIGFCVYKMNPLVETKWIEVQNLSGDTIFLSNKSSLAVRASDFCECKPNCIYFTNDWTDTPHIAVFNAEAGIIIDDRYPLGLNNIMELPYGLSNQCASATLLIRN